MSWLDITDQLSAKGIRKIKVGQILIFDFEGSRTNLKIKRKRNGNVWAQEVILYKPEQVRIVSK